MSENMCSNDWGVWHIEPIISLKQTHTHAIVQAYPTHWSTYLHHTYPDFFTAQTHYKSSQACQSGFTALNESHQQKSTIQYPTPIKNIYIPTMTKIQQFIKQK